MNNFVANRSISVLALSWFFAAAFVNDAANLTDIFPQAATLHFDEGENLDALVQISSTNTPAAAGGGMEQNAFDRHLYRQRTNGTSRHVILDLDSPSLVAVSLQADSAFFLLPKERPSLYHSYNSNSSLYLENRTLLI
jgi:hypothetical protein